MRNPDPKQMLTQLMSLHQQDVCGCGLERMCICGQDLDGADAEHIAAHQATILVPAIVGIIAENDAIEWAIQDAAAAYPPGPASTSEADKAEMLTRIAEAKEHGIELVLVSRVVWPWLQAAQ